MTIVTPHYRPKRAPRKKRRQPPLAQVIVPAAPMKKGPPRRLAEAAAEAKPQGPVIVTPKRARRRSFGDAPDMSPEEHRRRGDAADALFREIAKGD